MKSKKGYRKGECYWNAFKFASNHKGWKIVHGICVGQGKIKGQQHGHAWVEKTKYLRTSFPPPHSRIRQVYCLDPRTGVELPAEVFYSFGGVSFVKRYSLATANKKAMSSGFYGPWDERIKKAKHKGRIK